MTSSVPFVWFYLHCRSDNVTLSTEVSTSYTGSGVTVSDDLGSVGKTTTESRAGAGFRDSEETASTSFSGDDHTISLTTPQPDYFHPDFIPGEVEPDNDDVVSDCDSAGQSIARFR